MCLTDLGKLYLQMVVLFLAVAVAVANVPATSKNEVSFKVVKTDSQKIISLPDI